MKNPIIIFYLLLLLASSGNRMAAEPMRIISLAPSITETLFALGVGDAVVGVTTYCDYPPEVHAIHKVGNFLSPNFEKIVYLKPTLILMEKWPSSKTATRLKQLNLPVHEIVCPLSIAEIYGFTQAIGDATGRLKEAQDLNDTLRKRLAAIEARSKRLAVMPRIYVEIDLPTWTVGRDSFITEAISLSGGQNVFNDVPLRALQASHEVIVSLNPDVILSFEAKRNQIEKRQGWDQIRAVRDQRIIDDINRNLLSRGNYRLAEGVELLQDRLIAMQKPKH